MARFIVVDHCLSGVDGHHWEYDERILGAAAQAGYDGVLVTNHRFRRQRLACAERVEPLYRYSSYHRYSIFNGHDRGDCPARRPGLRWIRPTADWREPLRLIGQYSEAVRYWWGRERRMRSFVHASWRWWKRIRPSADDIIFFPTVTEFDFECLAEFLTQCRDTEQVSWHLQFHFPLLEGWPIEYGYQVDRLIAMRHYFRQQLERLRNHQVHFYVTNDTLLQQYELLGDCTFQALPYPTSPQFTASGSRGSCDRLTITCPGAYRPEKGFEFVDVMVSSLWPHFQANRVHLAVQHSPQAPPLPRPMHISEDEWSRAVRMYPFPLSSEDYAELIRHTDIGLFMYDAKRYYARVSGILVEMLSAGVPVIVPAACWLADQIQGAVYTYQERVILDRWECAEDRCSAKVFGRVPVKCTRRVYPHRARYAATRVCFSPERHAETPFIRQTITELNSSGKIISVRSHIVSGRDDLTFTPILVRLCPETATVDLEWSTPAVTALPSNCLIEWSTFTLAENEHAIPESAVGLIAADVWQMPALVEEMIRHYDHYRRTAEEFSISWRSQHAPERTVEKLIQMQAKHTRGSVVYGLHRHQERGLKVA